MNNLALLLNKSLKDANSVLKEWSQTKQDSNNTGKLMHDEAISKNPHIVKPGSEQILHVDSLSKLMRGNITADDALKQKLTLEKNNMLGEIIKESSYGLYENGIAAGATGGVSTGSPIAPIGGGFDYKKSKNKKKKLTSIIENAYKSRRK